MTIPKNLLDHPVAQMFHTEFAHIRLSMYTIAKARKRANQYLDLNGCGVEVIDEGRMQTLRWHLKEIELCEEIIKRHVEEAKAKLMELAS
jgi:hypothetical protein